jgi:hypothetical protein
MDYSVIWINHKNKMMIFPLHKCGNQSSLNAIVRLSNSAVWSATTRTRISGLKIFPFWLNQWNLFFWGIHNVSTVWFSFENTLWKAKKSIVSSRQWRKLHSVKKSGWIILPETLITKTRELIFEMISCSMILFSLLAENILKTNDHYELYKQLFSYVIVVLIYTDDKIQNDFDVSQILFQRD